MHDVRRPSRGFTLIELLVVLTILGVMLGIGIPSFRDFVANQAVKSASFDLATAMVLARSEAIKRNAEVTLEPADDGWQAGWFIAAPGDPDRLLHDHPAVPGARIDGPADVTYLPNGRTKGVNLPSFDIAAGDGDEARCVAVDLSGRPKQTSSTCRTP